MTDFKRIEEYYNEFEEKNRLNRDNSGKLEFEMSMRILKKYLPQKATILDLGGASGTYTIPLAQMGYTMFLADLSPKLIEEAKEIIKEKNLNNVKTCDVMNAIDLSKYEDNQFDVVILFGPLYHLLDIAERERCIQEVNRVLKKDGIVFASFIPYLAGSIAIIDRYFRHPEQVNIKNLENVFSTGMFNNASKKGFQEGYYAKAQEIERLFSNNGFEKKDLLSIRGVGYEKEDNIYKVEDEVMFENIISIIEKTAREKEVIETCGHAMYIGKKFKNI